MKEFLFCAIFAVACLYMCGCEAPLAGHPSNQPTTELADPFDPDRPPTAKTLYVMADMLAGQGKDQQARILLVRIIEEHPDFLPAYNSLAELHMRHRRTTEAVRVLNDGLTINPNDPVLLNNLGMCRLVMKDYEQALDCFTRAAGQTPENTRYRSNMATTLLLMNRRQEALALYEQILSKDEAWDNINILSNTVK